MSRHSEGGSPVILVPALPATPRGADPTLSALIAELATRCAEAITAAGGTIRWFDGSSTDSVAQALDNADGVLLLGGGDVDPATYGERRRDPSLYNVDIGTDLVDLSIARAATAAGRPVLAVCRGMHVVNVAHGGTLVQHLSDGPIIHRGSGDEPMVDHDVLVEPGTQLAAALGRTKVRVRSGHHQAVDRLGDGLRVVARTADGIAEALEGERGRVLAVQWHPEDELSDPGDRAALFDWLVQRAGERHQGTRTLDTPIAG